MPLTSAEQGAVAAACIASISGPTTELEWLGQEVRMHRGAVMVACRGRYRPVALATNSPERASLWLDFPGRALNEFVRSLLSNCSFYRLGYYCSVVDSRRFSEALGESMGPGAADTTAAAMEWFAAPPPAETVTTVPERPTTGSTTFTSTAIMPHTMTIDEASPLEWNQEFNAVIPTRAIPRRRRRLTTPRTTAQDSTGWD